MAGRRRIINLFIMQKGFALIYVLLITTLMTTIVIVLSFIFVTRIKISTESQDSIKAIYAADTGIEWMLYQRRIDPGAVTPPVLDNGATFELDCHPGDEIWGPCDGTSTVMRSRGRFPATGSTLIVRRALEIINFQ